MWRVVVGFVSAPFLGLLAFVAMLCSLLPALASRDLPAVVPSECLLGGTLLFGAGGSLIACGATLVLGLPLFLVLGRRGWLRWWQVALGGSFAGLFAAICLWLPSLGGGRRDLGWLLVSALFGAVGLVSGLLFWLVAVFRNRALATTFARQSSSRR